MLETVEASRKQHFRWLRLLAGATAVLTATISLLTFTPPPAVADQQVFDCGHGFNQTYTVSAGPTHGPLKVTNCPNGTLNFDADTTAKTLSGVGEGAPGLEIVNSPGFKLAYGEASVAITGDTGQPGIKITGSTDVRIRQDMDLTATGGSGQPGIWTDTSSSVKVNGERTALADGIGGPFGVGDPAILTFDSASGYWANVTTSTVSGGGSAHFTFVYTYNEWDDVKTRVNACTTSVTFALKSDATAPGGDYLNVPSGCSLTIDLNGHSLNISHAPDTEAAIGVPTGASLTVNATGGGALTARNPNGNAAGIGGDQSQSCGTVTLNGGTVTAFSSRGAGIGGGSTGTTGTGCAVVINGANVSAMSNGLGAGIGGGGTGTGAAGAGGSVTILSGSVDAGSGTGVYSSGGAAIGSGQGDTYTSAGTLTIAGQRYGTQQKAGPNNNANSAPLDVETTGSMRYRLLNTGDTTATRVSIRFGHQVSYDPNYPVAGGTPATVSPVFVVSGSSLSSTAPNGPGGFPAATSLADYTGSAWQTTGGTTWDPATVVTQDITLQQQWTQNQYGVVFTCTNGACDTSPANGTLTAGQTVTVSATPDTGYHFASWSGSSTFADATSASTTFTFPSLGGPTGETTAITGTFAINTYDVVFDGGAADAAGSTASQTLSYGTSQTLTPNGFTRDGYTFTGWALSQADADNNVIAFTNAESVLNLSSTQDDTVTLYAVWQQIVVTLSVTQAEPGDTVTITGSGFLPNQLLQVEIHSTPIPLGTITTGPTGSFVKKVTIPKNLKAGTHSIVLLGSGGGTLASLSIRVLGGLSNTGSDAQGMFTLRLLGASMLLLGGVLVVGARRRAQR